jgi:hypothetical protein
MGLVYLYLLHLFSLIIYGCVSCLYVRFMQHSDDIQSYNWTSLILLVKSATWLASYRVHIIPFFNEVRLFQFVSVPQIVTYFSIVQNARLKVLINELYTRRTRLESEKMSVKPCTLFSVVTSLCIDPCAGNVSYLVCSCNPLYLAVRSLCRCCLVVNWLTNIVLSESHWSAYSVQSPALDTIMIYILLNACPKDSSECIFICNIYESFASASTHKIV